MGFVCWMLHSPSLVAHLESGTEIQNPSYPPQKTGMHVPDALICFMSTAAFAEEYQKNIISVNKALGEEVKNE